MVDLDGVSRRKGDMKLIESNLPEPVMEPA